MSKEVNSIALAKILGSTFTAIGLALGILYSVGGLIVDLTTTGINAGSGLAFFALIGMPIIFGVPAFLIGLIIAPIFNLISKLVGGIKI